MFAFAAGRIRDFFIDDKVVRFREKLPSRTRII